jgi:hypothetical protein
MGKPVLVDEDILGCAVRYALPRKTYITSVVADAVESNLATMSVRCKTVILRDIQEAFDFGGISSHSCDREVWANLITKLSHDLDSVQVEVKKETEKLEKAKCPNCGTLCEVFNGKVNNDGVMQETDLINYIKCCNSSYLVGLRNKLIN